MNNDTCEITIYQCNGCEKWLPLTTQFFSRNNVTKTGYQSRCKICVGAKSYTHISPDGYRRCSKCKRELPRTLEYFPPDSRRPDGFKSECRDCKNKQRSAKKRKIWVIATEKPCSVCGKTLPATTEYFSKDTRLKSGLRAICKVCAKQYVQINPANRKEYYRLNKGKYRVTESRRRARKQSLPDTLTLEQWQYALDYFNGCCAVCGRQLNDLFGTHTVAQDHWIPVSYEGDDNPGTVATNIVPLCHGEGGCNNSKKDNMPDVWLKSKFSTRKANEILARIEAYFQFVRDNTKE